MTMKVDWKPSGRGPNFRPRWGLFSRGLGRGNLQKSLKTGIFNNGHGHTLTPPTPPPQKKGTITGIIYNWKQNNAPSKKKKKEEKKKEKGLVQYSISNPEIPNVKIGLHIFIYI